MHLALEDLSALLDGELEPADRTAFQAHLDTCQSCSAELASLARLDASLAATPILTCAESRELRSALADGQLTAGEAAIAQAHLASCGSCLSDLAAWRSLDAGLQHLPAGMPSARVNAAMRRLAEQGTRRTLVPALPRLVGGVGLRAGLAAALVLAIVIGLQPAPPGAPEVAVLVPAPAPEVAIVASVQQMVLYPRTNTLYVLQTADAAVDAVDATTYALRTRIAVGGRPTALALNEAAAQVLVLDASSKSLISIDTERNSVVATTVVPLSGTPTSMQVDATNGKIVISAAIVAPDGGGSGPPSPTPAAPGQVAVIDASTKKLEVIRSVAVAPRLVVSDPSGKGTLLVSQNETTLIDKTYQPLRTLPGGIGAAFGTGGRIAVLGGAVGEAILHLIGDGAPAPLRLAGTPQAVTSMPGGGFAVLLGSGSGNGRIVVVDESGRSVASADVDLVARDFAYDEAAGRFTVVRDGQVSSVAAPLALRPSTAPERSALPLASPSVAPSLVVSPSASPSPSGSASPVPSASTSPVVARPSPSAPASPPLPAGVPKDAKEVARDLYHVALMGGYMPLLWGNGPASLWILDDHGVLTRYDTSTAAITQRVQLPLDARVSQLAVGRSSVYVLDTASGRLLTVRIGDGKITSRSLPLLTQITAIVPGSGDMLWMALANSSQLLSLDTQSGRIEIADIGMFGVIKLAVDGTGAVWAADAAYGLGRYDPASGKFTQIGIGSAGRVNIVLPDPFGSVWVGTTAGEVFKLTGNASRLVRTLPRPVASLAVDPLGQPWYLAPAAGQPGFAFAPVDGSREARIVLGPALGLTFGPAWRAWLTDASGGLWVAVEAAQ